MSQVVGIDIGEGRLKIAAADVEGRKIRLVYDAPTSKTALLKQIFGVVDKLRGYDGIGVAAPGLLNANKGIIHRARNLGIKDLHIVEMLDKRYKVQTFLINESVASVLGEKLFGLGVGHKDIAFLRLSAGIECAVILDNKVLLGKDGNAHEMGHTVIDANSDVMCGCGRRGHWEAFCSGAGIPVFAKHLLDTKYSGSKSSLRNAKALDARAVFGAAKKDPVAKKIINEIARLNTMGVANIVEIYDPELLVIGGRVAISNPEAVLGPIKRGIRKYTTRLNRLPEIRITSLGDKATMYGAVADFL